MDIPRKKIRYMKELQPEEQKWLAKAVITVILADNLVEEKQVQFIKKLTRVFMQEEEKETINEIARLLREKELPTIEEMVVDDPERLIYMLNTLVSSIFANERKTPEEVRKYFKAGLKLGVSYEVLMLKLTYQKERFRIKMAQKQVDETIRDIVAQRKAKTLGKA